MGWLVTDTEAKGRRARKNQKSRETFHFYQCTRLMMAVVSSSQGCLCLSLKCLSCFCLVLCCLPLFFLVVLVLVLAICHDDPRFGNPPGSNATSRRLLLLFTTNIPKTSASRLKVKFSFYLIIVAVIIIVAVLSL